jgi:hypothetical protein
MLIVPMRICHACKKEISRDVKVGRRDVCPSCGADLRCCFNCRFYDRSVAKQCRETVTELVREKGKANYCEYFAYAENRTPAADAGTGQARKALDDLFKE